MKKVYIQMQTEKSVDNEELIIVTTHESMVKKLAFVIFVEK